MRHRSNFRRIQLDVQEWLEDHFTIQSESLGTSGRRNFVCECAYCGKDRKMYVAEDTGVFHCFSCEEKGALYKLVSEVEKISEQAAKRKVYNGKGYRTRKSLDDILRKVTGTEVELFRGELPDEFVPLWGDDGYVEHPYIAQRGISPKMVRRFRLGYCDSGRYANRVIFPTYMDGKLMSFQGRDTTGSANAKYMGPANDGKSELVFGFDLLKGDEAIVVEGPTDCIAMHQKGWRNTVALLGKTFYEPQMERLKSLGVTRVTLMLDGNVDEVDVEKAADLLTQKGISVVVARLEGDLDPDEAEPSQIQKALDNAVPPKGKIGRLRDRLRRIA